MKITTQAMMFGLALGALSGYSAAASAKADGDVALNAPQAGVVAAQPVSAGISDRELDTRVGVALDHAPYLYARHIEVTSRNGIVTLHGMVGSASDLEDAVKISSRVDGVKNVVDQLEIWDFGGRSM